MDRNEAIKRIRDGLKKRSGKSWSVTGGRGTAWGWITVDAPPARRTAHYRELATLRPDGGRDFEYVDTGEPGGYTTPAEREELAKLLALDQVPSQGLSIPASTAYYEEHVARAEGRTPEKLGEIYWD